MDANEIELNLPAVFSVDNKWNFSCTLEPDESLLTEYNEKNGVDYTMLSTEKTAGRFSSISFASIASEMIFRLYPVFSNATLGTITAGFRNTYLRSALMESALFCKINGITKFPSCWLLSRILSVINVTDLVW